jgi:hypothetical protein
LKIINISRRIARTLWTLAKRYLIPYEAVNRGYWLSSIKIGRPINKQRDTFLKNLHFTTTKN